MFRKVAFAACLLALATDLPAAAQIAPDTLPALEPGDLLFKGAETGNGTRLAAGWSLGDKRWGHVGIVVAEPEGGFSVIHADTGPPGGTGAVRRVQLATFLTDVETVGLYTVDLEGPARAAYLAEAESEIGLPFDRGFSLSSENSVYCSELVWRALSAGAGEDIVPIKSERLGRVYVSVSDISESLLTHEAAVITSAKRTKDEGGDRQTTRAEAR